jgi:hypothetical protein
MGDDLEVQFEMWVEVELIDEFAGIEPLRVQIVQDELADMQRGFLGLGTPLAQAILGRKVGETIEYQQGDIRKIRIVKIEPAREGPDPGVASRREMTFRKAIDQSDRTNAVLFASSFSGKWGDYDPKGIEEDPDDTEK